MAYERIITIDGNDFSEQINKCQFSWKDRGGCDTATLVIEVGSFDEFFGIEQGDDVIIKYDSSTAWWRGIVAELQTTLEGVLTISCIGTKARLAESIPQGRYGADVDTTLPTAQATVEAAADSGAPGAEQDDYIFIVTAIDEEGETHSGTDGSDASFSGGAIVDAVSYSKHNVAAANKKITFSWTASTKGAKGYRVYMNKSAGVPAIEADFTSAGGMVRYDIVGTSFVYDGSEDGEPADWPFAETSDATSRTATIVATDVESCLDDLFSKFLPAAISTGTVDVGVDNDDLDFFDLKDNSSDFARVLDSLMDVSGVDLQWYVDAANAVQVKLKDYTTLLATFNQGASFGVLTDANILAGLTKRKTRDGIATVKVNAEAPFEEGEAATQADLGVAWDRTTQPSTIDASVIRATDDPRVISIAQATTPTTIPTTADKAWVTDNYPTLQAWLDAFPNQRHFYLALTFMSDALASRFLKQLRKVMQLETAGAVVHFSRGRIMVLKFPGVRTLKSATQAANNWMVKRRPNPTTYSIIIENADTLIVPGQGIIRVTTEAGNRIDLPIVAASYEFAESVKITLQGGDKVFTPEEEATATREAITSIAMRPSNAVKWGEFCELFLLMAWLCFQGGMA